MKHNMRNRFTGNTFYARDPAAYYGTSNMASDGTPMYESMVVADLRAALAACLELEKTDVAGAEFWRRLAGSLRKAISML